MKLHRRGFVFLLFMFVSGLLCSCIGVQRGAEQRTYSDWVKMSRIYSDHMVLQRDVPIKLRGTAEPDRWLTVALATEKRKVSYGQTKPWTATLAAVHADEKGQWTATLDPMSAGGPYTISVTPEPGQPPLLTFTNVMVGEVWLASGQSNMGMELKDVAEGATEVAAANYPNIRLFQVESSISPYDLMDDVSGGTWQLCSPGTAEHFSAAAYFFGRELQESLDVPIGLINSSRGGTPIEPWISHQALKAGKQEEILAFIAEHESRRHIKKPTYEEISEVWWNALAKKHAKAFAASKDWYRPDLDDSEWETIHAPRYWEENGLMVNGLVWMRKHLTIPAAWEGQDLMVHLGVVDDCDHTFFNGHLIGSTGNEVVSPWLNFRKYKVPGNLVKAGDSVLAVRVVDHAHGGGLGSEPDLVFVDLLKHVQDAHEAGSPERISLAGDWRYKIAYKIGPGEQRPAPLQDDTYFHFPGTLYNAMIAPWTSYPLKGVIWYQGENNAGRADAYADLAKLQIESWREAWGNPTMSFLTTQLTSFGQRLSDPNARSTWAELREAQDRTLELPNTGVAVTYDIGDAKDIHPKNKQDVGHRLALIARNLVYGDDALSYAGPTLSESRVTNETVRLTFLDAPSGLVAHGDTLRGFALAGEDGVFFWAEGQIEGNTVLLESKDVSQPVWVKYAWANNTDANLFAAKSGLPARPFRLNLVSFER